MATNPSIIKLLEISWAEGTTTNTPPTDGGSGSTTWKKLEKCIYKLPELFPEPEKIEARPLDLDQALNIIGITPAVDDTLGVYPTDDWATQYLLMLKSQADSTKGNCFWFRVKYPHVGASGRTVSCRMTIAKNMPTATGTMGELDQAELAMTNIDKPVDSLKPEE